MKGIKKNIFFIGGLLTIIILYLPFFFFGENSYLGSSMDYLDSNVVWMKILSESGQSFSPNATLLPNIEHQFRVSYGNELDFIYLLFNIFTPFFALVINSLLIAITGYFSLFKLGEYITPTINKICLFLICLTFALLNFWQFGGISTAGCPLIILVFLKLIKKEKISYLLILFVGFYIFYSNFIVYGMFLVFLLSVAVLYFAIKTRNLNRRAILMICLIFIGYLITNYRFLAETIRPTFISNRNIGIAGEIDWHTGFSIVWERFWTENAVHSPAMHQLMIITFIGYFIFGLFRKLVNYKTVLILFVFITFNVFFSYFNVNVFPGLFKALKLDFVFGLTLYRFYFFNGLLWYIILILIVADLNKIIKRKDVQLVIIIPLLLNLYLVTRINIPYQNIRHTFREYYFSYSDYYMIKEFQLIDSLMPKDKSKYKVISYGFDPAAAQYNGYYTADGYFPYYEKSYKQKFRKLITPILNNNIELRGKYDSYMSQNFVFVDNFDIGQQILQKYSKQPKELMIDKYVAQELNIDYVFSSIPLTNDYLVLENSIRSKYWEKIYVYKINTK